MKAHKIISIITISSYILMTFILLITVSLAWYVNIDTNDINNSSGTSHPSDIDFTMETYEIIINDINNSMQKGSLVSKMSPYDPIDHQFDKAVLLRIEYEVFVAPDNDKYELAIENDTLYEASSREIIVNNQTETSYYTGLSNVIDLYEATVVGNNITFDETLGMSFVDGDIKSTHLVLDDNIAANTVSNRKYEKYYIMSYNGERITRMYNKLILLHAPLDATIIFDADMTAVIKKIEG